MAKVSSTVHGLARSAPSVKLSTAAPSLWPRPSASSA